MSSADSVEVTNTVSSLDESVRNHSGALLMLCATRSRRSASFAALILNIGLLLSAVLNLSGTMSYDRWE